MQLLCFDILLFFQWIMWRHSFYDVFCEWMMISSMFITLFLCSFSLVWKFSSFRLYMECAFCTVLDIRNYNILYHLIYLLNLVTFDQQFLLVLNATFTSAWSYNTRLKFPRYLWHMIMWCIHLVFLCWSVIRGSVLSVARYSIFHRILFLLERVLPWYL